MDFPLLSLFAECGKRMPRWRTWEIMAWQPMNSSNLTQQETSSWLCVESSIFGARFCVPPPVMSTKLWMINYRCYPSRSIGKVISIAVQINPRHFKSFEHNKTKPSQVESGLNQTLPFAMATPHWPRCWYLGLRLARQSFLASLLCRCRCEAARADADAGGLEMGSVNGTIKLKKSLKYMTNMLYIIIIIYIYNVLYIYYYIIVCNIIVYLYKGYGNNTTIWEQFDVDFMWTFRGCEAERCATGAGGADVDSAVGWYGGWLRNPAAVDRCFIPLFIGLQPYVWWCRISQPSTGNCPVSKTLWVWNNLQPNLPGSQIISSTYWY